MTSQTPVSEPIYILAVDDEPSNNELMQRAFRGKPNRKVLVSTSPKEGLELLRQTPVQIILADYSMPEMTGVEFLDRARAILPNAICIMVTGYPELGEVVDAQSRGVVQHIVAKPWRLNDLFSSVERAISMRDLSTAVSRLKEKQKK